MLSKVVKGGEAKQMQVMIFASAPAHSRQPIAQPARDVGPVREDQSGLLDKIRLLEAAVGAAQREGFEAGRQQGEQDARASLNPVLARMSSSITEIVSMRPDLRRRAEKDAVDLALKIAARVLHRELAIDTNALNALARVVFDRLARSESWQLTVHPQFADAIRGALPSGSAAKVQIQADPATAPGSFLVRCVDGVIDASVDTQLAEITRGLTDRLTQ